MLGPLRLVPPPSLSFSHPLTQNHLLEMERQKIRKTRKERKGKTVKNEKERKITGKKKKKPSKQENCLIWRTKQYRVRKVFLSFIFP